MRNPYEVLEIREDASQEEIKKAYREMVKKYHPDQYQNNPLSELAEDKLREINEAYDYLMKNNNSTGQNSRKVPERNWDVNDDNDIYRNIKIYINNGNLAMAEDALNNITNRDAMWHYLKGVIFLQKGWYNEAYAHLETAVRMDPSNYEYRNALNQLNAATKSYRGNAYQRGFGAGPSFCDTCSCLCCADTCCECGGGDLISCC